MLNLSTIPFSRYGSYFAISKIENEYYLRDMHGGDESPFNIFKLSFYKNNIKISPLVKFTETSLKFFDSENICYVEVVFGFENTVNIIAKGLTLQLGAAKSRYDSFINYSENRYLYELYTKEVKMYFNEVYGEFNLDAPWKVVGNEYIKYSINGENEDSYLVIEDFKTVQPKFNVINFEDAKRNVESDFENYKSTFKRGDEKYITSFKLAIYITWSCVVRPFGNLTKYAMYMSKNWMNNIWSWDNCFNAMMLKDNFMDLALNQFELFVGYQDEYGQYPDFINDKFQSFNCVKPPIHAFALKKLYEKGADRDRVKNICDSIEKSTFFWTKYRALNKKYPFYNHGNDSGWDNASIFHEELPVVSPDLTAYLIRQFDILSEINFELGFADKAKKLKLEADELFDGFLEYFYEDGFVAKTFGTEKNIKSGSLILHLPIVIGYRFEKDFLSNLVKKMLGEHLEKFGLATENKNSKYYKYNGYWQGPIWAPTTYIIVDALRENGYEEEAFNIAKRFCDMTLIGGMAENFDPITGEGLVDKAFTWTSSVFLLLQNEFF